MKGRVLFSGLVAAVFMLSSVEAQVIQLGRLPIKGKVRPVGGLLGSLFNHDSCDGCDAGCIDCAAEPGCGMTDPVCGAPEPGCGVAAPTCGLVGTLLSGPGCGLPEPSCGSTGLGYSGGFGLCGGSCDDGCGRGGYLGRQLHKVNPCACGGSLIADMARGLLLMVDRAVGAVVGGVFGGLQAVSCHASGTFAALECAASAGCDTCGGACDGGCSAAPSCGAPSCGVAGPVTSYPMIGDIYSPAPAQPMQPTLSEPPAPTPVQPIPDKAVDPFIDDPVAPQARLRQPNSVRRTLQGQVVRNANYLQQLQKNGSVTRSRYVQPTSAALKQRYLQAQQRSMNLRR